MAMGYEQAHAAGLGERQGVVVVAFSVLDAVHRRDVQVTERAP
jgi:hypothetical protein